MPKTVKKSKKYKKKKTKKNIPKNQDFAKF